MVAPVVFLSGFKVGFVTTWKASCGKLWNGLLHETLNLLRNVSSIKHEKQQSQSRPTLQFTNNSKHQPSWYCIEYIVTAFKMSIYEVQPLEHSTTYSFCVVVHIRWTACVQWKFEGVYLIKNHRNNGLLYFAKLYFAKREICTLLS